MLNTITNSGKSNLYYGVKTVFKIVFITLLAMSILGGLTKAQSGLSASVNGTIGNAEVKLFGNGQKAFDIFGGAISVSQGRTIVGSRWADTSRAGNAGAAYIFSQDVNGRYQEEARLQPQDVAASDEFGASVAIDGDIAVVGAFGHDGDFGRLKLEDSGAVYVYTRRANGNWVLQAKLEPSDATAGLSFGRSVAIENNTLVVGAAGAGRNNTGGFYVFELDQGAWIEGERITPPRANQLDEIGASIAIDGNTILVSGAGANDAGTAYIYRRNGRGWQVEAGLSAGDNKDQTYFGYAVALDDDVALVGALGDDSVATDAGAAYIFERQTNGDWKAAGKLSATDASRDDKFGGAVALQNGIAVVAAEQNDSTASDAGAVYLYSRQSEGNWQLLDKVTAVDANRADHFGSAIALDNGKLAVGALRDDDLAENSGSAYVYDISSLSRVSTRGVSNSALTISSRSASSNQTTVSGLSLNSLNSQNNGSATAVPVLAPLLALPSSASGTTQSSTSDDYSQIRGNNGSSNGSNYNDSNYSNNNGRGFATQGNDQQGQVGQLGQGTGMARNLGSSQGLNNTNQGFGNQGLLNNSGLGFNQNNNANQLGGGLNANLGNSQGFNSSAGNGFGSTATNRNLGSGQNLNQGLNQNLNQGFGLNNNNGLNGNNNTGLNSSPLFAAPSGSNSGSSNLTLPSFNSSGGAAGLANSGSALANNQNSNQNNAQNNNQNNNQGEGFLGIGRFFRNPNRTQVEDDSTPRLSDITEQPSQQNNGFLGLGKLRNLGNRNNNNANQGSSNTTGLNRDTRANNGLGTSAGQFNQGFSNQGLNNQGFSNQGFSNQGLNNQGLNNQNTGLSGNSNAGSYTNIMNLRNQISRVGDYVELELPLFDTPVTYLSGGLPQGLQLDARQGIIFGEIARGTAGNYDVVIQVDDGQNQLTEGFSWRVDR